MTVTTSSKNLHRMRRWALAPTIVALAAGATVSGAGIGSADTATSEVGVESSQPAFTYAWRVHNFTDQTLTAGEFHRDEGAGVGSALAFGGTTPWAVLKPGEVTADAFQHVGASITFTWGRVCYKGQVWNMPRVATPVDPMAWMTEWEDVYVFAMGPVGEERLMVTPERGGRDVDMMAYGESC